MNIEDPREVAPTLLLDAYKNQPNYLGLIGADANRLKDLYDTLSDIRLRMISIEDGEGEQLDRVGAIVGEPRWTSDDEAYRRTLRVRVLINRSNGTTPELLQILKLLCGLKPPDSYARITELQPMRIEVDLVQVPVLPGLQILFRLVQAKMATVALSLAVTPPGDDVNRPPLLFGWSGDGYAILTGPSFGLGWSADTFGDADGWVV